MLEIGVFLLNSKMEGHIQKIEFNILPIDALILS
jgi:hypothetical protein